MTTETCPFCNGDVAGHELMIERKLITNFESLNIAGHQVIHTIAMVFGVEIRELPHEVFFQFSHVSSEKREKADQETCLKNLFQYTLALIGMVLSGIMMDGQKVFLKRVEKLRSDIDTHPEMEKEIRAKFLQGWLRDVDHVFGPYEKTQGHSDN